MPSGENGEEQGISLPIQERTMFGRRNGPFEGGSKWKFVGREGTNPDRATRPGPWRTVDGL